jgi:AraC-like DNA-binding protein
MREAPESLTTRLAMPGDRTSADAATDVLRDLLDTLRLDTLVYGRFELGTPWGIQFPDDDPSYLIVVGRGDVRLEVEGVQAPLMLSAGDVALLPHGGTHRLREAEASPLTPLRERECLREHAAEPIRIGGDGRRATLVICAFRFRAAHRTLSIQHLARSIHIAASDPSASPGLAATAQLLIAESSSRRPGAAVVMNRLADILLIEVIRAHIASSDCPEHGLRALNDPPIASALALIHRHPEEPWTIERLANAVALSRSAFAARFSMRVGAPPPDYLARWRMTKAAELLRDGALAMSQIAARSGYRSEASFNRAFKRLEGVPPGAYRRRQG